MVIYESMRNLSVTISLRNMSFLLATINCSSERDETIRVPPPSDGMLLGSSLVQVASAVVNLRVPWSRYIQKTAFCSIPSHHLTHIPSASPL